VIIVDFEKHVRGLGYTVESRTGDDGVEYTVIRSVTAPTGKLVGSICDVAIRRDHAVPYIVPAAIHTKPALVPSGTLSTSPSGIGSDWQYWSRRFDRPVTARGLWTHILTVLGEVQ
jgi:hypothetical protein